MYYHAASSPIIICKWQMTILKARHPTKPRLSWSVHHSGLVYMLQGARLPCFWYLTEQEGKYLHEIGGIWCVRWIVAQTWNPGSKPMDGRELSNTFSGWGSPAFKNVLVVPYEWSASYSRRTPSGSPIFWKPGGKQNVSRHGSVFHTPEMNYRNKFI
jgi:hypothetical protein